MAILSVVLAQMATASYDTCETQWAVLHFDPATAKITRNNLGGRGPDASTAGENVDNPNDPLALTAAQEARVVNLLYRQTSTVALHFEVSCCGTGRNFLFSGVTRSKETVCPPARP